MEGRGVWGMGLGGVGSRKASGMEMAQQSRTPAVSGPGRGRRCRTTGGKAGQTIRPPDRCRRLRRPYHPVFTTISRRTSAGGLAMPAVRRVGRSWRDRTEMPRWRRSSSAARRRRRSVAGARPRLDTHGHRKFICGLELPAEASRGRFVDGGCGKLGNAAYEAVIGAGPGSIYDRVSFAASGNTPLGPE